jgi:DNA-binding protein HU-beta
MAAKKTEGGKKPGSISKSALINAVVEATGDVSRKHVKSVLDALSEVAYKELKKSGVFTMPGFAKFRVVKKPATKARQGINPFTKQPITIKGKPAQKKVRATALKALKDLIQ